MKVTRSLFGVLLVLVLLFSALVSVSAQDTIDFGQTVAGTANGAELQYTFNATGGATVTVTLSSEVFDTLIRLEDASGAVIAQDDDGGEGLNSLLTVNIPADGTYTIVVTSFSGEPEGAFELSLTAVEISSIAVGDIVDGVANGVPVTYELALEEDNAIIIELVSPDFDTLLTVRNADGGTVVQDDDSGVNLNSFLIFVPPTTGDYTITANSFGGAPDGSFTLSITVPETVATLVNTETEEVIEGGFVSGELGKETASFTFDAVADADYIMILNSDAFDPLVRLNDAAGNEIASDDDSGGNFNALLEFTPSEAGTYEIVVTSFDGTGTGAYDLTVVAATLPVDTEDLLFFQSMGFIGIGETIEGTAAGELIAYQVEAEAGERLVVDLMSEEFDAFLQVQDFAGELVVENDDGGNGLNSRAEFEVPVTTVYNIIVRSFSGAATGSFTLTVTSVK